jgi:hypothetical protein
VLHADDDGVSCSHRCLNHAETMMYENPSSFDFSILLALLVVAACKQVAVGAAPTWRETVADMANSRALPCLTLSPGVSVSNPASGKWGGGGEWHCSHSSRPRNEARKEGRRDQSTISSVFSLLPASSHERVNVTSSVREPDGPLAQEHRPPPAVVSQSPSALRMTASMSGKRRPS